MPFSNARPYKMTNPAKYQTRWQHCSTSHGTSVVTPVSTYTQLQFLPTEKMSKTMPSSRATKKPPPKEAASCARKKRGNATPNQTSKVITRSTAKLPPTANTGHSNIISGNNISGRNLLDDIEEQNLVIEEQKSAGEESHNQSDKPVNEESNNQSDKPVNLVMPEQTAQDLATAELDDMEQKFKKIMDRTAREDSHTFAIIGQMQERRSKRPTLKSFFTCKTK